MVGEKWNVSELYPLVCTRNLSKGSDHDNLLFVKMGKNIVLKVKAIYLSLIFFFWINVSRR